MTSLQSHLLIATPQLPEPFARAVVLLVRHNDEGALGLILNRRTSAMLKDAWSKLSEGPCHREASIFLGGPCEGPLVALHTNELLLEMEVMPGLYFSAGREKLETLAAQNNGESASVKFFAGYSGWAAGQLEHELKRGSWSVMPARLEHVFEHEDELWVRASRFVSDAAWRTRLGIKHTPPDLRVN
ncbi:MAG: YqgE/AlgH family protein [Pirellulales bacterium]